VYTKSKTSELSPLRRKLLRNFLLRCARKKSFFKTVQHCIGGLGGFFKTVRNAMVKHPKPKKINKKSQMNQKFLIFLGVLGQAVHQAV
jgi:hypothetical protein